MDFFINHPSIGVAFRILDSPGWTTNFHGIWQLNNFLGYSMFPKYSVSCRIFQQMVYLHFGNPLTIHGCGWIPTAMATWWLLPRNEPYPYLLVNVCISTYGKSPYLSGKVTMNEYTRHCNHCPQPNFSDLFGSVPRNLAKKTLHRYQSRTIESI